MNDILIKKLDILCVVGIATAVVLMLVSIIVFCACFDHFCSDPNDKYYGKNKPATHVKLKKICGSIIMVLAVTLMVVSAHFNSQRHQLRWDYAVEHDYHFYNNNYFHEIPKEEIASYKHYCEDGWDRVGVVYDDDRKTVILRHGDGFNNFIDNLDDVINYYKNSGK